MPSKTWPERLHLYAELMRLRRPIGALLLLWPVLWALWIAARGVPSAGVLFIFVCGVFIMRSAGCVINDYADRDFDLHVERTKQRPLASGAVSTREALCLFAILLVIALALVAFTNMLTITLAPIAVVLAATYPFMKRFTHFPQAYLGLAFGWGVPMAFAAQTNMLPPITWLVFSIAVIWALAYDTIYAMVDRDDDLRIGIKSTAVLFGDYDRAFVLFSQLLVLALLVMLGKLAELGVVYYVGLSAAAACALYQQWLIRARERGACFAAFLNNNWFGAAVFAGIAASYA